MNFFRYTSLEDEIIHGLTIFEKIAPLILLIVTIIFIYRYNKKIKSLSGEKYIRYTMATLMMIGEFSYMLWNYLHSLNGDVRFINTLPLHLCSYAIWGLAFVLITKSKKVYNYLFIFGVVSTLALFFPNVNHGLDSFRYYQLFFSHSMLMVALIYMFKVHDFYPQKSDFIKSFILLQIIIVFSLIVNVTFNTEFLFIGPGNKPIDFALDWPWHMIEYELFMAIIYYLFYVLLKKVKN